MLLPAGPAPCREETPVLRGLYPLRNVQGLPGEEARCDAAVAELHEVREQRVREQEAGFRQSDAPVDVFEQPSRAPFREPRPE